MVLLRPRSGRLTSLFFSESAMELILQEDSRIAYRADRMYSNIIGKKLLARIVKHLGYEVLYEFGFTNQIVERMIKK
jgi:hypothetical protein